MANGGLAVGVGMVTESMAILYSCGKIKLPCIGLRNFTCSSATLRIFAVSQLVSKPNSGAGELERANLQGLALQRLNLGDPGLAVPG